MMWVKLAGGAALIALTACASNRSEESRMVTDTTVTSRRVVDTTLVTTDTTISVDTTRIEGDREVITDTAAAGRLRMDTTTAE